MKFKGSVLENETFPDDFVHAWMRNFTTILSALKVDTSWQCLKWPVLPTEIADSDSI